jgi:arginine repressor
VAIYIDYSNLVEIVGTIAGDDNILIIAGESFKRRQLLNALESIFPGIEKKIV